MTPRGRSIPVGTYNPRTSTPPARDGRNGRTFQGGQTSRLNGHWLEADGAPLNIDLAAYLHEIRRRLRHEQRNNPTVAGLVRDFGTDVMGPAGPSLQITPAGAADVDADGIAAAWADWCEVADLRRRQHFADLLTTCIRQLPVAGEYLLQMQYRDAPSRADAAGPVRLRVLPIGAERLDTPMGAMADPNTVMGVVVDPTTGAVVGYHIARADPSGLWPLAATKYDFVPAAQMLHVFEYAEADQVRGVPWLSAVVEPIGRLRQYTEATVLAAEFAARIAAYIHTTHPAIEPAAAGEELKIWDIEPGTASQLPEGWTVSQLTPQHPGANYKDFRRDRLGDVGRPMSMPYLRVAHDASGHNFSSARLDMLGYWGMIDAVRAWIVRTTLTPLLRQVATEYLLSTNRPPGGWLAGWTWPAAPQIDPVKAADAATRRLAAGITSLPQECAGHGTDWQTVLDQTAAVAEYAAGLGLSPPGAPTTPEPRADDDT